MRKIELWVLLFIIGFLGFNWPFLEIFSRSVAAYLFLFWFVFIVLVAFASYKNSTNRTPGSTDARQPHSQETPGAVSRYRRTPRAS